MLKIGLIGDIHGNLEALEAVLEYLSTKQKVDKIVVLGDIVGYMANPNECVELVKDYDCIQGNHDSTVVYGEDLDWFNPVAKEALIWTINELTDKNKNILRDFPLTKIYREEDFTISHGTLNSPEKFLYMDRSFEARESFDLMETQLLFIGHTHVPQYFISNGDNSFADIEMVSDIDYKREIQLQKGKKYIFNIGSVGQPRDHNYKSCFVIYDTDRKTIKYVRLPYKVKITARKVKKNRLPKFLYKRILVGM
ncbi:MAG: metallophosphoesterase family protein [Candidatus Alkaliphilus sp. MAG34]|nr:metallophosphoesterase family protein [Clostridiales bacterium]